MAILYALITIIAWGTWLVPSQRIPFRNPHIRTFYISIANFVLAALVLISRGSQGLTMNTLWLPILGGLIWAVSGYCAFMATDKIGLTRAIGVWAPLNLIVGLLWGVILFNEFAGATSRTLTLLLLSVAMMLVGILIIIFARGTQSQRQAGRAYLIGFLGATGAGILWGTYFIPISISKASMWEAAFPLAIGILVGSTALMLAAGDSPKLARKQDYARALLSGLLWGIGNYAMLLLTEAIGTGKGFAIAQLNLVINVAFGILWFKDPRPGTRAAAITFLGIVMALVGGMILGSLR